MTDTVPVTQADRALFFDLFEISEKNRAHVMAGGEDQRSQMQAIARHRLAAEQSRATPAVDREPWHTPRGGLIEAQTHLRNARRSVEESKRVNGHVPGNPYDVAEIALNFALAEVDTILALYPPVMGEVEAENTRLREALKPFAKAGSIAGERNPYGDFYAYRPAAGDEYAITGDHLRAAYAALATLSTEQVR